MQDVGVVITAGGRALCRAGRWGGRDELIHEGKLYHPVGGRGWVGIGGKITNLKAGHLYLIPPHSRISYATQREITVEWLHFRLQSPMLDVRLGSLARIHHFSMAVAARWTPVCGFIERFMREPCAPDAFRIQAMLQEVIGLTLSGLPQQSARARLARERLVPALQFLDAQAIRHPSLSDIARTVNLSPEHFHRLFHAIFHTTPYQDAQARRMALAKSLLAEGLLAVAEVAERCGYDDPFYFSRVFRRHFGVSPGRVRRGLAILGPTP